MKINEFEKLGLSKDILKILDKAGFGEPTEIQKKTIPLVLAGRDVIGSSATGSGKTLAFASSMIEQLKPNEYVQALILTPTRELAEQVASSIRSFSKEKHLDVIAVYGGVDIQTQMRKIRKVDIIVATPGRVLDHINRRTLRLDHVKFLVLDEVDRMFDMGFHKDVEMILKECPTQRQTMLFSATISPDIDYLAKKYTKNPVEITVESYVDPSKLNQIYYDVPTHLKFSLLVHLLKEEKSDLEMIFCSTRRNVDFVTDNLVNIGIDATAIHGGLAQNKRLKILNDFHGKGVKILVCTDVAARGLDIKGVSHVYNYDLPKTSDEYIHRIGRTARAGNKGKAINLLSSRDYENFGNILSNKSLGITLEKLPKLDVINVRKDLGRRPRQDNFRGRPRQDNFSNRGRPVARPQGRSDNRFRGRDNFKERSNLRERSDNRFRGRDNNREKSRSNTRSRSGSDYQRPRQDNQRPRRNFDRKRR